MSPLTAAERAQRYRDRHRAGDDLPRRFLRLVIDQGQSDASSIRATVAASDLLAHAQTESPVQAAAGIVERMTLRPIPRRRGPAAPVIATHEEQALQFVISKLEDGKATAADVNAGLLVARRAIREGRRGLTEDDVLLAAGRCLLGYGAPVPQNALGTLDGAGEEEVNDQ